jgi:hypothetical protein
MLENDYGLSQVKNHLLNYTDFNNLDDYISYLKDRSIGWYRLARVGKTDVIEVHPVSVYSIEYNIDLKKELKLHIKNKNKEHINEIKHILKKLFVSTKAYGKQEEVILAYVNDLLVYDVDSLKKALHYRLYESFPSLNEIEENIKAQGFWQEFLYEINGY